MLLCSSLICGTLLPGVGSGLLISVMDRLNLFYLTGRITLVVLTWKWMGLFLRKSLVSFGKNAFKKYEATICSNSILSSKVAYYLYQCTIRPRMEYCCHVWAWICWISYRNRYVGQLILHLLSLLNLYRLIIASLNLFYRY